MTEPRSLRDRARPLGGVLLAFAVGLSVYLLSCLLLAPGPHVFSFGEDWQRMSAAPFELRGQFPQRLLAPLLAWLCGCGGERYVLFARGLSVLLLAVVFLFCRQRRNSLLDAVLVTAAVGCCGAVQVYKQWWVGYVDDLSYALFLLAAMAVRRPWLFWSLWCANLLNHELAAFMLPWLWWLRRQADGRWRTDLLGAGAALAAYAGVYLYVWQHAPGQVYNASYFAEHALFPWASLWLWILMLVQWLMAYGPLLVVLAWHQHIAAHGRERLELWLVVLGVMAIFGVAFDFTRHCNLLVLPLVLASSRMLAAGRRAWFVALVAAAALLFQLLPPFHASAWPMRYFLAAMMRCGVYADYHKVISCLLPQTWPAVLAVVGLLSVSFCVGRWLARRPQRGKPMDGRGPAL